MSQEPLRIVVFGYHTIGYCCLKALLDHGEEVCAIVTHQDDPHEHDWFESVAELAQTAVELFQDTFPLICAGRFCRSRASARRPPNCCRQ